MEQPPEKKLSFAMLGQLFNKKNWLFLVGIAGILLIFLSDFLFSGTTDTSAAAQPAAQQDANAYVEQLEKRLEKMVGQVQGAGKTSVMITLETSGETLYAQDESADTQTQTGENGVESYHSQRESQYKIIDGQNGDEPIITAQLLPEIKGVAVLCEGGDDIEVVSRVTELVSVVLGLGTNRICVTKMI